MWKAIKDFFRSFKAKVAPVLDTVSTSLPPSLTKITCSHDYKIHKQSWIRVSPSKNAKATFKLKNHGICNKCSKHEHFGIS